MSRTTQHESEEAFCPACNDFRLFDVSEHEISDVVLFSCMACEWSAEPNRVPHDAAQADELYPEL